MKSFKMEDSFTQKKANYIMQQLSFRSFGIIPYFWQKWQKKSCNKDFKHSQLNQVPVENCGFQSTGKSPCLTMLSMSHMDVRDLRACKP